MHRIRINAIVPLLLVAGTAAAQDMDPTVEVSRIYQGKMIEVSKPMIEMQIPDSVTHFDLDFDYSVFDSPYKGTYEFNPYVQSMKPQPDAWTGRRLFVRAGAGYPLHPVFGLVWSPALKGKFRMSAYATHRSYIGRYRYISPVSDGSVCLDATGSGNGFKANIQSSVGTGVTNVALQSASGSYLSMEHLCEKMGSGIIVTDLEGVFAGVNTINGSFSLLSKGMLVENGKPVKPFCEVTIAGNIYTMLEEIEALGDDPAPTAAGSQFVQTPSILLKGLTVSGL